MRIDDERLRRLVEDAAHDAQHAEVDSPEELLLKHLAGNARDLLRVRALRDLRSEQRRDLG